MSARAMSDSPREVELKFALPGGRSGDAVASIAVLAGVRPRSLSSVYYDTAKGALRRAGLSLRVREEDGAFVQTIKDGGDGVMSRGVDRLAWRGYPRCDSATEVVGASRPT